MDNARMIQDGTFSIVQDVHTKHIEVKNFDEVVYTEDADRLFSFEELIATLMRERTKYFMREG